MNKLEITAYDGYPLKCRVWEPKSNYKSDILCVHGIQSHSGWYEKSAEKFSRNGYRVIFPDRRGSGLNTTQRGDLISYKQLIADILSVLKYFSCPTNLSILSISWGAKIACLLAKQDYPWFGKLILQTPGIIPGVGFSLSSKLTLAKSLILNKGSDRYDIPIPNSNFFTHDKKFQHYIDNDKLTLTKCTARFFVESLKLDHLIPFHCKKPTFLLLAEDDRIIDNDKTVKLFEKRFSHRLNRYKIYPNNAHTLEFDDKKLSFVDDIIDWIG